MNIYSKLLLLLLPTVLLFTIVLSFVLISYPQIEIIIGGLVIITFLLIIISKKIVKPITALKNLALSSAAGNYAPIVVNGPKEIIELANTINTMSECLKEQITKLQESALMRERMYGEYECSVLLQHYMLQKVIENYSGKLLSFKTIDLISDELRGLILNISEDSTHTSITLVESAKSGFKGIFELLGTSPFITQEALSKDEFPSIELTFEKNSLLLSYTSYGLPKPFVWSTEQNKQADLSNQTLALKAQDFIFIYNQGFSNYFSNDASIQNWLSKVLRHFAKDGLDITTSMLEKELLFLSRKKVIDQDIHLICMQLIG